MLVHSTWLEIARMVVNSMFLCSHELLVASEGDAKREAIATGLSRQKSLAAK